MPLPNEVRQAIKNIRFFALLFESGCDEVYGYVAFQRAQAVLWLDDCSIYWFLHLCDTAEVSNGPALKHVRNKRTTSAARCVVGQYAKVRVFVLACSIPLFSLASSTDA